MNVINLAPPGLKSYSGLVQGFRKIGSHKESGLQVVGKKKQLNTVGQILEKINAPPDHSVLIGTCLNGLPIFLEFSDPSIGSILVVCDQGCGKTHQLQVISESAVRLSQPGSLQIAVLSLNPGEWTNLLNQPFSAYINKGVFVWYEPKAQKMIETLTGLAEKRRQGQCLDANILFFLDDLQALEDLNWETQVNLRWLLEYGPQSNIWPIATLQTKAFAEMRFWVETFKPKITGSIVDPAFQTCAEGLDLATNSFLEPGEFSVNLGNRRLQYRLPMLGD